MESTATFSPDASRAGVSPTTYFVLRRLHSLFGVVPLGLFLFNHLFMNSFAGHGAAAFNEKVVFLRGLPMLPLIEFGGILVPLVFHAILGIVIALQARHNAAQYRFGRNWMYSFQRYTGWLVFGFVIFHVATLRFAYNPEVPGAPSFFDLLHEMFKNPALLALYWIGGIATIYHFSNGLCTFCMTWGITISRHSQRAMAVAAAGVGLALFSLLAYAIFGFMGIHLPI